MPKKIVIDRAVLPFIETCTNLSNEEKRIIAMVIEGEKEPWTKLGISRSAYYYRFKKAYKNLQKCLAGETVDTVKTVEKKEDKEGKKSKKEVIRGSDPDKTAVQQSLKVIASAVGKRSAEQMKEILEVGIIFYDKFKYIKEVLGIPWDMLVEILYKVYIEHRDEIEIPYLELFEKELLKKIADALEEIKV